MRSLHPQRLHRVIEAVVAFVAISSCAAKCPANSTYGDSPSEYRYLLRQPVIDYAVCLTSQCADKLDCNVTSVSGRMVHFHCKNDFPFGYKLDAVAVECQEYLDSDRKRKCYVRQSCFVTYGIHWQIPLYILITVWAVIMTVLLAVLCVVTYSTEETLIVEVPQSYYAQHQSSIIPPTKMITAHLPYYVLAKLVDRKNIRNRARARPAEAPPDTFPRAQ